MNSLYYKFTKRNTCYNLAFVVMALFNCTNPSESDFTEFDFTYSNNSDQAFSLKYTGRDTLYLHQYWHVDSINFIPHTYVVLLSNLDKSALENIVRDLDFSSLPTDYPITSPVDANFYGLYIKKGTTENTYYPSHQNASNESTRFINYFIEKKKGFKYFPTSIAIDFKSAPIKPDNEDKSATERLLP